MVHMKLQVKMEVRDYLSQKATQTVDRVAVLSTEIRELHQEKQDLENQIRLTVFSRVK